MIDVRSGIGFGSGIDFGMIDVGSGINVSAQSHQFPFFFSLEALQARGAQVASHINTLEQTVVCTYV